MLYVVFKIDLKNNEMAKLLELYREIFLTDPGKIADLKRSRVSLKVCKRNPGEINYTSRILFSPQIFFEQNKKLIFFEIKKHFWKKKNIKKFFAKNDFLGKFIILEELFFEFYFFEIFL